MQERIQKGENVPRTLNSRTPLKKQMPIESVLQRYSDKLIQRKLYINGNEITVGFIDDRVRLSAFFTKVGYEEEQITTILQRLRDLAIAEQRIDRRNLVILADEVLYKGTAHVLGGSASPSTPSVTSPSEVMPEIRIPKKEYIGGPKEGSHIHQYGGGFHLKLGAARYNIVQKGTFYQDNYEQAMIALHAITGEHKEWAQQMIRYINAMAGPYREKK